MTDNIENGESIINRALKEVRHSAKLAKGDTEKIWGWASPAGRLRAQRRAKLISTGAELQPGKRALEIGCGTGLFTQFFAETGAEIVAMDISPELIEKAKEKNLPENSVTFVVKPFENLQMEKTFDAVIGSSILHHLDLERSLQRIYQLLKPGGRLSFAEPNMLNPQIFLERKLRFIFPQVSPDETAFIESKLLKKLREYEFQNPNITPFDWLHPSTPEFAIPFVKAAGRLMEKMPVVRNFAGSLYITAEKPGDVKFRNLKF